MQAIDPKRLAFADAIQAELTEFERESTLGYKPTRLCWLVAGLAAHYSESVLDIIETADKLYKDDVRRESARKAAKGVTT